MANSPTSHPGNPPKTKRDGYAEKVTVKQLRAEVDELLSEIVELRRTKRPSGELNDIHSRVSLASIAIPFSAAFALMAFTVAIMTLFGLA